jgi:hypothetical protein
VPLFRLARTICLVLIASNLFAAGIWNEVTDGGDDAARLPENAQATFGVGPLTDIIGRLGNGFIGADMYLIRITDFNTFSATSSAVGRNGVLDPALYLFDFSGHAIYGSDNNSLDPMNPDFQATLPAGDPQGPEHNGLYFILIAPSGNDPLNKFGNFIFPCGCTAGTLYPQTKNTIIEHYSNSGIGPAGSGRYDIHLTSADFANVPEPGTLGIGVGALLGGVLARRRKPMPTSPA